MNPELTDADLKNLWIQNPLAAEMIKRIMLERQVAELIAEKEEEKPVDTEE